MNSGKKQNCIQYLTLPEVAERLGLGQTRRRRRAPDAPLMPEAERAARAVRRLIRNGQLLAVLDGGRYLVREDWLKAYEDQREGAALRRQREFGAG